MITDHKGRLDLYYNSPICLLKIHNDGAMAIYDDTDFFLWMDKGSEAWDLMAGWASCHLAIGSFLGSGSILHILQSEDSGNGEVNLRRCLC